MPLARSLFAWRSDFSFPTLDERGDPTMGSIERAHVRILTAASLALAAMWCPSVAAQEWTRQAPFPTGRNLKAAAFISPTHAFIVGENRHLLETADGGDTWKPRIVDDWGAGPFYDVHFFDERYGYVTGNNSDAFRTIDGGQTWIPMTGVPAGSWRDIKFFEPGVGVIGANGALAYTDDGGLSWQVQSGYPDCPIVYGMDFWSVDNGLVAGHQARSNIRGVFRTQDTGRTWTPVLALTSNDVAFISARTALAAVVGELSIYRSTDGGQTWRSLAGPFEADGPMSDLEYAGGDTVFGISGGGDIWRSTNGGASWTRQFEGVGDLPYDWRVRAYDRNVAWATGPYGLLVGTTDGGDTWRILNRGMGLEVTDVEMFTDAYGYTIHRNGFLSRTTDGGEHWDVRRLKVTGVQFGRDEGLSAVHVHDADFAVVGGPGGVVFITEDGGDTWEPTGFPDGLPGDLDINAIGFSSRTNGWVVGQDLARRRRSVFRTTDGGRSWFQPFEDAAVWVAVEFADDQYGSMHTAGGRFLRTIDGGESWTEGALPDTPQGSPIVEGADYVNRDVGWVVGWWGAVERTLDGGRSWQVLDFGRDIRVALDVAAVSAEEAWVVAADERQDPLLLHTIDGGRSWTPTVIARFPEVLSEISRTRSGSLWAGGFGGAVFHMAGTGGLDCDAIHKLSAKCRGGKLTAKVKSSLPQGTELTIDNDGDPRLMMINARGKGKVRWTGQSGMRDVCIAECPEIECAAANCG
ncbi:MAG: hypothetical protein C4547_12940 [Phycisphaerales bacterium]|nr:MAG: hypothetical protein C4547_12940 [Phycisphaerales bacterium]